MVMNISAANCDFLECLSPSSVEAAASDGMTYVELATFAAHTPDDDWAAEEVPNFSLRLFNSYGLPHYKLSVELSPCRSQLDPSMVDRISHLTHCRPAFLSSSAMTTMSQRTVVASTGSVSSLELKEDLFMTAVTSKNAADTASTLEVDMRCTDWTIELSIPVADLRDHTSALARPPWWVRRVRDEKLVVQLKNARVQLPKFDPSVMDAQGSVKITCSNAIGSLIGDPDVLCCDATAQKFLYASGLKDSPCSISLKWDLRNKSLRAEQNASPDGDMATSSWGSYFRMPSSSSDGPFSRKVVMHENEELTIVGSRQEMSEFGRKCLQNTDLCVEINAPLLRLQLPSKQFYEIIYNRLVNDLALWEPSSPAYRASMMSQTGFDIHVAGLSDGDPRFQLCRSTAVQKDSDDDESDDESVRTLQDKTRGPSRRTTANKFSLLLNTSSARILVGASCLEENNISGNSELAIEAGGGELFVVTGYQGDPNVVYFYVSLGTAHLWHQNLLGQSPRPYANDVAAENFARAAKGDLKAEPTPENVALCKLVEDDNVAVALRIALRPKDNAKDILAAIGIRNTTVHMHPFAEPGHFWITQLIDFFDVPDYPIAGYELPKITTELHVHAMSSTVSYDHSCVKAGSPLKLRLVVDSCDVSSRIVQQFAVMKLQCLFEEAKLYMCGKPERERHVNFNRQQPYQGLLPEDFVCLMRMGLFDLEVTVAQEMMLSDEQKASMPDRKVNDDTPMMEIKCRNDMLKIWTCADSLVMLVNAAVEIAESDLLAKPVQKSEEQQAAPARPELTPLVEHQLEQMVKSAMFHTVGSRSEVVAAASVSNPSSARSSDSTGREALLAAAIEEALHHPQERINSSTSDDDFCIVDEIPGSGIMLPSGEPRIRKFSESGIEIAEHHFMTPQQRSNPVTKLPRGYPQPLIRYLMRDFSILLHIYGGSDFASACEAKSYSVGESRQGKGQGQRVEADAQGGPNRDHSVLVEVQLTKICFLFEMFGGNAPALARHLLTLQDVEVRDRLTASQINKMLYQYASGQRPRRTCAPMIAVRLLETHNGEGKLKISMLPLRLNFDQDTLEFIQDFGADLAAGIQMPIKNKNATNVPSEPIMEVPNHLTESQPQAPSAPPAELQPSAPLLPSMEDSVSTLAGLFAEDEPATVTDNVDIFDFTPTAGSVRFVKSPSSSSGREWPQEMRSSSSSSTAIATSPSSGSISAPSPAGGETFFKHFSFSPSVTIRLDYQGKRVKTDQGAVLGLLIGLSQLHCTELHLKELHNRQGMLGLGRCVQYALNEWVVDIRRNQLPQVVGSYGPISSLVQIAQGIRDLFLMPVDEYRKVDGHVVKGIQRGAESFGVSTAAAAVEITQRMVGLVQGVAEFAFDIVTPEYPPPPARRRNALLQIVKQPNDFREGLHMAYDAVREGVVDTAEVLHLAAQEDRAQGRWPLRGLLRQATPTVLRPIVVASRATGHVLGGLRSQLRPDTHREELEKWRQQST
uniref:Autophagy-related protein 2 n=1 Tax=Plectus sambesii TaxID=2011161 RepID=A0A914VF89_9BILA